MAVGAGGVGRLRTPEERATASIPGAVLVTPEVRERISALPKDTMIVLHCHHGGRSQAAAEQLAAIGFTNVWNVQGGIDAWSQHVDPGVPGVWHGDKDKAVPVDYSRAMVKAIKDAGGTRIQYKELPGVGHNAWTPAYKDAEGVVPWMFSLSRE